MSRLLRAFGLWLGAAVEHIREAGPLTVAWRALVIWAIDAALLLLLIRVLPGLAADRWQTAVLAALVIGLLNALLRPLVMAVAVNLPIVAFAVIVLLLNAALLALAAWLLPGFAVGSVWTAVVAAFLLSALNSGVTTLLHIDDDDSFYRNVIRRIQRRAAPAGDLDRMGTVVIQIDGLAEPVLRQGLAEGRMPTLARWLASGGHRLVGWECDIPSMTSSSQAGILFGNNANIPAFRWYDKELGRLLVSNHPADARIINARQDSGRGLLRERGSSVNNIFTGDAEHTVMTMATLVDEHGKVTAAPRDFVGFFASPYNLTRLMLAVGGEVITEYRQAWRQRRRGTRPRMHRGGVFPFQRAGTNVLLQQLAVWLVISDMQQGRMVSYCDLLGYDEVAHHAGPASEDALGCLTAIDRQLRALEQAGRSAPRRYQFVVLSDHGQSWGATFLQRYGYSLEELVRRLIGTAPTIEQAQQSGEGAGYVSAALSLMASTGGVAARGVRRLAGRTQPGEPVTVGQDHRDRAATATADVVVCGSGNLGLISFTTLPGRASLELLEATYPGLIDGLRAHAGIGWLLVHSQEQGALVLGRDGVCNLDSGAVEGADPLAAFPPSTAGYLKRLSGYPNVADIMVNSTLYDAEAGEVAAFEELIGCHGGAGGWQTQPFLVFPSSWTAEDPQIRGAEAVHAFLARFIIPLTSAVRT